MGILGDDADPPLFLKPLPQVQQVQEEEDTPKPSDSAASSRKDTKQSDPRRSCSLPSCSAPTPNRYVSATDAPGYVFPGKRTSTIDFCIFRPRLHGIGSKWIRTQSVTDRPCVYTGLDGSEPIWICYPYPNGITFEGDPVWIRSQKGLVSTGGIGSKLVRIGSDTIKLKILC